MTTTLTARPGAPARPGPAGRPVAAARPRPRLLLPPTPDPAPCPVVQGPTPALPLRSVLSPVTAADWPVPARAAREPEPELRDPVPVCGAVVVAAIEALRGARPLAQLARWVSPEVYEALSRAIAPTPVTGRRAVVWRVRVSRPQPTVAEGSVVVHDGTRVRAAAVRLEAHRGAWRATVLQIG